MLCVTNMLLHGIEDPSFVRHDNTLGINTRLKEHLMEECNLHIYVVF